MPSGPVPKKAELRQRRNKESTAKTFTDTSPPLVSQGKPGRGKKVTFQIPKLPPRKRGQWRDETLAWWEDLWRSPMAEEYIEADLHQLYLLADLIDMYWRLPAKELGKKKELANEIRLQRQCFGLTPIDRRRLQWEIERGDSATAKGEERRRKTGKSKSHKVDPRKMLESKN